MNTTWIISGFFAGYLSYKRNGKNLLSISHFLLGWIYIIWWLISEIVSEYLKANDRRKEEKNKLIK